MSLALALSALCETLHTHLGVPVTLGAPESTLSGVHVWPWRLEEVAGLANTQMQRLPLRPGGPSVPTSSQSIHFLVLVPPATTLDDLAWLAQARQTLLAHPVLQVEGVPMHLMLSPLSVEQLTAVFTAAQLPLRLCLSAVLRGA